VNSDRVLRVIVWCGFWLIVGEIPALSASPEAGVPAEIRRALEKWPGDFNAKDAPGVCGLFAPDLVASYPGQPDRNYDGMCRQLTAALENPKKTFHYEAPQIEGILVSGDLAVVRLVWTLSITDRDAPAGTTIKEKGIDVFTRQQDGAWKISISHAYPYSPVGGGE
jgi:ketosteroid isomerase-like protein